MSVCFTLVSLSALVRLSSVQPTGTAREQSSHTSVEARREASPSQKTVGLFQGCSPTPLTRAVIPNSWPSAGFVTDSFFYPLAAIFHMAWLAVPLHARLVDEWPRLGPHTVRRPVLRGLTAFIQRLIRLSTQAPGVRMSRHCLLCGITPPQHTRTHQCVILIYSQQGPLIIPAGWGLLTVVLPRQQRTLQMWTDEMRRQSTSAACLKCDALTVNVGDFKSVAVLR